MRHAYGKEGKRVDYTPHTCMKCISSNPGAGEHHGCPYKTFGEEGLRAALGGMQISSRRGLSTRCLLVVYSFVCSRSLDWQALNRGADAA